ncbi:MAG: hypothetical protein IJ523_07385 [Succinivibrionaceae bacterium]|nr:hypothetical protein [Succinivibrionaceae bacterium]
MIYEHYLGGVLCHYGVKGMKWGVRRTPEQLGHKTKTTVEKTKEAATIIDGVYHSSKGFTADQRKFSSYCLKDGTEHAKEFFDVGYKPTDADRLFRDIESGFDLSKKIDSVPVGKSKERFSIPMRLGTTAKSLFRTMWQKDGPEETSRFITAYVDR